MKGLVKRIYGEGGFLADSKPFLHLCKKKEWKRIQLKLGDFIVICLDM